MIEFFLKWELFRTNVVEKIKTHFYIQLLFPQSRAFLQDNVEKYGSAGQPQITIQYGTWTLHTG
jgi:hypothetical protein